MDAGTAHASQSEANLTMHTPRRKSPSFYPVVLLAASSLLAPTVHAQLCAAPDTTSTAVSPADPASLASFSPAAQLDALALADAKPLPTLRTTAAPQTVVSTASTGAVSNTTRRTLPSSALIELATEPAPQTGQATNSEEPAEPTLVAAADFSSPQTLAHVRTAD